MAAEATDRIRTLDLVRGVAVLGILAVNVASFAAPENAAYSPDLPHAGSAADRIAYLTTLVLFEGKMRALFSILFGASLLLFVQRAEAAGHDGAALQIRRLGWLLLFGYLHFALIWDGDILFLYALLGFAALGLRHLRAGQLVAAALLMFAAWQAWGTAMWTPSLAVESAAAGDPGKNGEYAKLLQGYRMKDARDLAEHRLGWGDEVSARLGDRAAYPLQLAFYNWGETLPWMLLGMALLQNGLFAGEWSRQRLKRLAASGLGLGGLASLGFAGWAAQAQFPELAMRYATSYGLALPHTAMALGYAALLALTAPRLLATKIGQRLEAAGRMAFSNYIGTSLLMGAIMNGWGLGLYGRFGAGERWGLVVLAWLMMLGWSRPWLLRFRQGPLEWLWRSLTQWRLLPLRLA